MRKLILIFLVLGFAGCTGSPYTVTDRDCEKVFIIMKSIDKNSVEHYRFNDHSKSCEILDGDGAWFVASKDFIDHIFNGGQSD